MRSAALGRTPADPNKASIEAVALDVTAFGVRCWRTVLARAVLSSNAESWWRGWKFALSSCHGLNGEDGTLQGMLELANLPYTSTGVAGGAPSAWIKS